MSKDFEFKGNPLVIKSNGLDASSDYSIQSDDEGIKRTAELVELIIVIIESISYQKVIDKIAMPLYEW